MTPKYCREIERNVRKNLTRKELKYLAVTRHGLKIPKNVNLRNYVSRFHAEQQYINGGGIPSQFWINAIKYNENTNMENKPLSSRV